MAGSEIKRQRRERWQQLKRDPTFFETLLEGVASGLSLMRICTEYDVSYAAVDSWLRALDDEKRAMYARARESRAQYFVHEIERITHDVAQEEGIDPKRAKVAGDNLRWLAARHDPHLWGDNSKITHEHKGAVDLHLQALRPGGETRQVEHHEQGETYDNDAQYGDESDGSELL